MATQPASINGVEFDVLISITEALESTVPEYPVETGFVVSDSVILSPETLDMILFVSERPVTWKDRFGDATGRVEQVCQMLRELYFAKELVSVTTSELAYTDMAIISISFTKSTDYGYAMEIPIKLKKVRTTTASTTTIPESYGKSGTTEASAGSASTSTGTVATSSTSSTTSTSSSASSSSSSTSSSSSSTSSKSGSILYNLASSAGFF